MAKRNSTKTATKEALQSSEPKIQRLNGWNGININDVAPGVDAFESYKGDAVYAGNGDNQPLETDINISTLLLQNNARTTMTKSIETRRDTELLYKSNELGVPTGTAFVTDDYLFFIVEDDDKHHLCRKKLTGTPTEKKSKKIYSWPSRYSIKRIGRFQSMFLATVFDSIDNRGVLFFCKIDDAEESQTPGIKRCSLFLPNGITQISSHIKILTGSVNDPVETNSAMTIKPRYGEDAFIRYTLSISYTNALGSTTESNSTTFYTDCAPEEMNSEKYIPIYITVPDAVAIDPDGITGLSGMDIWYSVEEYVEKTFMGHVSFEYDTDGVTPKRTYLFNWLGAMQDTSAWIDHSSYVPTENTTAGVDAEYFTSIDGRMYYWGGSNKNRLYIGGNPGNELSVARGNGGAFVDIEPGSGYEIMNCLRFKTQGGSNIVTVLCNSKNSTKTKRYNIIETKLALTNEVASKAYAAEEVQNVIGCVSREGSGAFADGLYSLGRYGLTVTTQMMEYNSQLRSQLVSQPIQRVFENIEGYKLENAKVFYLNDIIYMAFAFDDDTHDSLDSVIFCYDINLKAWYTYSLADSRSEKYIKNIIAIDSIMGIEGIGIVHNQGISFLPTTGKIDKDNCMLTHVDSYIETHEIGARTPPQDTIFLCQGEFRFDWFVGNMTIYIDGIDYYGRPFTVKKQIKETDVQYDYPVYIRVDRMIETYRIRIVGKRCGYRLTHILCKCYTQSKKVNIVYGFDSDNWHTTHHHGQQFQHHRVDNYNNLVKAIVP